MLPCKLPCATAMTKSLSSDHTGAKLWTIQIYNNSISHQITQMSANIEKQLADMLKVGQKFSLQMDENTDVSN